MTGTARSADLAAGSNMAFVAELLPKSWIENAFDPRAAGMRIITKVLST